MKRISKAAFTGALLLFVSVAHAGAGSQPPIVAESLSHPMELYSGRAKFATQREVNSRDASFIKVHFSDFRPPPWMVVEVSNPEGTETYFYSRDFKEAHTWDAEAGDDGETSFSAMSISGDTAIIRIHGKPGFGRSPVNAAKGRVFVDRFMRGLPQGQVGNAPAQASKDKGGSGLEGSTGGVSRTETICGNDERFDAVCWADTDPDMFDRTRPVAKLIIGRTSCTGFRVGPDNLMFTNNHCIGAEHQAAATEVWFNYQATTCGDPDSGPVVKVSGAELVATDYTLDYTLFTVSDFAAIEQFGNYGLEVREAVYGEAIYIPQHGAGLPKQLAVVSDMNPNGLCQVDAETQAGRAPGTDIGYYCDSVGGSSGSPVVLAGTHKAIALHHYGGCMNGGVKMSEIWPKVTRYFGREVPEGDFGGDPGEPNPDVAPTAAFGFSCSYLECAFDGSASSDPEGPVASWSWDFGDGQVGSGASVAHAFSSAGTFAVTLTVTDGGGNTGTATKSVTVAAPAANKAPTAAMSWSCDALACRFDGAASSDPDGQIASYDWSFGDGATATGAVVDHAYAAPGQYEVLLRVTDDKGLASEIVESVSVTAAPNASPEAAFTHSCQDLACSFDGSGSRDADGSITDYEWDFGDRGKASGRVASHAFATAGTYVVTLRVTDNQGAQGTVSRDVVVEVAAPPPGPPPAIELSGAGFKDKGKKWAELSWRGSEAGQVEILRDGARLLVAENNGVFRDETIENRVKSAQYKVCEVDSEICSNELTVAF